MRTLTKREKSAINARLHLLTKQLYEQAKLEMYRHFEDLAGTEDLTAHIEQEMGMMQLKSYEIGRSDLPKAKLPF